MEEFASGTRKLKARSSALARIRMRISHPFTGPAWGRETQLIYRTIQNSEDCTRDHPEARIAGSRSLR